MKTTQLASPHPVHLSPCSAGWTETRWLEAPAFGVVMLTVMALGACSDGEAKGTADRGASLADARSSQAESGQPDIPFGVPDGSIESDTVADGPIAADGSSDRSVAFDATGTDGADAATRCHALAMDTSAAAVTPTKVFGTPDKPTAGTIVNGRYRLTADTFYIGQSLYDRIQETILIDAKSGRITIQSAQRLTVGGNLRPIDRRTIRLTEVKGAAWRYEISCPPTAQFIEAAFSASADRFELYLQVAGLTASVSRYERLP